MRVFFDLDGTLCDTPHDVDHDDPADLLARCSPKPDAIKALIHVIQLGHVAGVVTARGRHVATATHAQLEAWLGPWASALHVHHRPRLLFDAKHWMQDKADTLKLERVDVYVGDRNEDRGAAHRAGARFVWAHHFAANGLAGLRAEVPA